VPHGLAGARRVTLGPLSESEAAELLGGASAGAYAVAGGNPFYLAQLARVGGDVAVASAVEAELARLSPPARLLLEAGAVAGDPEAVALLTAAADALRPTAPGSAARFYAAAAGLGPAAPLHWRLADAQAAAGDPAAARATLLRALDAPAAGGVARLALT